jgi:oxygen-independent coproporphyrinogen-3 oxidase
MNAVEIIKKVGIPNFSTDLIIGFAGQTDEAWDDSVERAISFAPDTISTYLLTIRPDAWFERTGLYASHGESLLYRRYERAREALYAVGYVYDSNIRYKIPGRGGLLQKVLQFRGVPVLGIGAGARSYTNTADYIVGGHNRPALSQISDYITAVSEGSLLPARGFIFDDNERIRKRLALDLFDLHLDELAPYGFSGVRDSFTPVLVALVNAGLLQEAGADHYQLTRKGYEYRDVVSGLFFSDRVKERDRGFYEAIRAESGVKGNMAAVLG